MYIGLGTLKGVRGLCGLESRGQWGLIGLGGFGELGLGGVGGLDTVCEQGGFGGLEVVCETGIIYGVGKSAKVVIGSVREAISQKKSALIWTLSKLFKAFFNCIFFRKVSGRCSRTQGGGVVKVILTMYK